MVKQNFNNNWVFEKSDGGSLSALMNGRNEKKIVNLPYDASIHENRNTQEPNGSGNGFFHEDNYVYKKTFTIDTEYNDKNIWFEFEGVYQNAFVYMNNAFAGKCPYGYSNFYVDVTNYIKFGEENEIKVIVRNGVPSGRWYTGGGIYRDVNLMIADRLHFACDGVRLFTKDLEDNLAVIQVNGEIEYTGYGVRDVRFVVELQDAEGNIAAVNSMPMTIADCTKKNYEQMLYLDTPKTWDAEHPYLYTYTAKILEGDTVLDMEKGTIGIRKLQLDPRNGLRVNGKTVKLRGGCIHHDHGVIGAEEFKHAAEDKVKKLKKAGFNAIRSSHYPMSRRLLEACDKLGMYVMDEYSDVWTTTKVAFDYGIHMTEWWEHDIENMVKKDFNHPCVIMYSIGNEIPEVGNKFDVQWGKKFSDKVRSLDDTRYVTNSMNILLAGMEVLKKMQPQGGAEEQSGEINSMMADLGGFLNMIACSPAMSQMIEEACGQVDVAGFNYAAGRYEIDGMEWPNRILVGSETNPKDLDVNWSKVETLPYVIGDFDWTAWDYLGENGIGYVSHGDEGDSMYSPYPFKAAYCGDINLIGDRRPISYWREIIWGLRKKPYLCVQLPQYYGQKMNTNGWSMTDAVRSWNFSGYEGKNIVVEVYTDAEEGALYINDVLIEKKTVGTVKKAQVLFDTVYSPGKVEVVVYNNGEETGRDSIVTAQNDVKIQAAADTQVIPADGSDIAYIDISMVDSSGTLNMEIKKNITIFIEGAGVVEGFGSADPKSEENYFDSTVRTYEGRLRAVVRATGTGEIKVSLSADQMETVFVELTAK